LGKEGNRQVSPPTFLTADQRLCYLIEMIRETAGNAHPAPVRGEDGDEGEGKLDFGVFLRQTRLRRGFTLPETAMAVRVPEQYLEALELGDYDTLPPKPYVKGFLDAYSAHLSLDPEEVWQRFEESFSHFSRSGADEGRAIFAIFRPQGEKLQWRDWGVPMILVVAALSLLTARSFLSGVESPGIPDPPIAVEQPPAATADVDGAAESDLGTVTATPAEDGDAGVRLLLRAESASWLAVEKDGAPSEEWTMEEGETRVITARERMVLSLGNAGAVQLNVNGRELGFIGNRGEVKRNILLTAPEE
jgi:transcriptional regulator with XRE-family HTH domain